MTDSNVTKELEKKLLSFITEEDPMLCMLQWITEKFMEIEVANKVEPKKANTVLIELHTSVEVGFDDSIPGWVRCI